MKIFRSVNRRKFLQQSATLLAAVSITSEVSAQFHTQAKLTVGEVIALIKKDISFDESRGTVDTLKTGDPNQAVSGIVTTMFATVDVIRKAIELKANFIIAHEPTFYNHTDETEWLEDHAVFLEKKKLIEENKIAIWRFHDYWHAAKPDGIMKGVLQTLEWEDNYDASEGVIDLDGKTLEDVINHVKKRLEIPTVRYIGELSSPCNRVVLQPGAYGGRNHIKAIHDRKPDLFICGELQEWETSEYIRDARSLGHKISLIVLGHAVSEEPGMDWLVSWLEEKVKGVRITHIPSRNPFQWR